MYRKTEVITQLNKFAEYSCAQNPKHASSYKSLMVQLISAVENYYSADRSAYKAPLNELQLAFYNDLMKRATVVTKPIDLQMGTDFPKGYDDLSELFYSFPWLNTSVEAFHNAWVTESSPEGGSETVKKNTLIDSWTTEVGAANADELANIKKLFDWLASASSNAGMVMLWEDLGEVKYQPSSDEIARKLFIEKKLKEVIEVLGIPAYKPTYI